MARIGDIARVTSRTGIRIPDIQSELQFNAYCLYEAVRNELIRTNAETVTRGGIPGLEAPVSVPSLIKYLWPGMTRSAESSDEEMRQARLALYDYLHSTGNLICVNPGNARRMSIWWARNDWDNREPPSKQPEPTAVITVRTTSVQSSGILESGETSEIYQCAACTRPFRSQAHLTRHLFTEHFSIRQIILTSLKNLREPVTLSVIAGYIRQTFGYSGSAEMIRCKLVDMTDAHDIILHQISNRDGTGSFRRYTLNPQADFEPLDPAQVIGILSGSADSASTVNGNMMFCREPGCIETFNPNSWGTRHRHETLSHPDSPFRVWPCPLCTSVSFYDRQGLTTHLTNAVDHGFPEEQVKDIAFEVSHIAQLKMAELLEARGTSTSPLPPAPEAKFAPPVVPPSPPPWESPPPVTTAAPAPAPVSPVHEDDVLDLLDRLRKRVESDASRVAVVAPMTAADEEAAQLRADKIRLEARVQELEAQLKGLQQRIVGLFRDAK